MTENKEKKGALILLLETATETCSVALAQNGTVIASKDLTEGNIHARCLTLFIDEVMRREKKMYEELAAVAVSKGPGSYTGLRIGTSVAKGICFAADIPLLGIDTLKAMSIGLQQKVPQRDYTLLCPMIDARRMEVYTALYDRNGNAVENVQAKIINKYSFDSYLEKGKILFFGSGASKIQPFYIYQKNAVFVDFENNAAHLASLAEQQLKQGAVEDLAYFEPFYLKDFIPGVPVQLRATTLGKTN